MVSVKTKRNMIRLIGNIVECKGHRRSPVKEWRSRLIGNIVECKGGYWFAFDSGATAINRKHSGM